MQRFSPKIAALAAGLVLTAGLAQFTGQGNAQAQDAGDALQQVQPSAELTEQGKALFDANCVSCHGAQGKGDGLAASALNPKPRNFHVADGWKNGREFAGMYKTLEEGIPGGAMGAYSHLLAKERVAIITYVRSLAASNYPAITAGDIEKLEQDYDFSQKLANDTKIVPIPVSLAITKLIEEAKPEQTKIANAGKRVMADKSAGAQLFLSHAPDSARALMALSRAGGAWKSSLPDFVKVVTSNAGANGFSTHMGALDQAQWQNLHSYLKSLI